MLRRLFSILVATAAALTAQSPLTTTFANNNNGSIGGAAYFTLAAVNVSGVTIPSLDLNLGPQGASGTIDVYVALGAAVSPFAPSGTWQPWSLANPVTAVAPGSATPLNLNRPIELGQGCVLTVAVVANGLRHHYTNGSLAYPPGTLYGGLTPTVGLQNIHLQLMAGEATNVPFAGARLTPRIVNTTLRYTVGGKCPNLATVTPVGQGCLAEYRSFYEFFPPGTLDLAGKRVRGTSVMGNAGAPYVVTVEPSLATFSRVNPDIMTPLAIPSNGEVAVGTAAWGGQVHVGEDCKIAAFSGLTQGPPSAAAMLSQGFSNYCAWFDVDLSRGGGVYWVEGGGTPPYLIRVLYENVQPLGGGPGYSVEFSFHRSSGNFTIDFAISNPPNSTPWLVGYGAGVDPGPTDLSGLLSLYVPAQDVLPLTLAPLGGSRPWQGPNLFRVETSNIPTASLWHLGYVGFSTFPRPFRLDVFGFPSGCSAYCSLDVLMDMTAFPPPSLAWTALPLGGGSSWWGLPFCVQSFALPDFVGPRDRSSNGLSCVIGGL